MYFLFLIKDFFYNVDKGVRIFKNVYGTLDPILDKYGGSHTSRFNNNTMKAISGYDNIRHHVLKKLIMQLMKILVM